MTRCDSVEIPMPVSLTAIRTMRPEGCAMISMWPRSVNFTALESRLIRICLSRAASASTAGNPGPKRVSTRSPFSWASGLMLSNTEVTRAGSSTRSSERSILPASILLRSRIWLINASNDWPRDPGGAEEAEYQGENDRHQQPFDRALDQGRQLGPKLGDRLRDPNFPADDGDGGEAGGALDVPVGVGVPAHAGFLPQRLLEDRLRGEILGLEPPVVARMGDDATATVDDHRLAVHADPAVGGEPLHLREVHGAGEKPDQMPPRIEDGDGNDDRGHARITFGADHIGVLGPDPPGVEHVLDVVPIGKIGRAHV